MRVDSSGFGVESCDVDYFENYEFVSLKLKNLELKGRVKITLNLMM